MHNHPYIQNTISGFSPEHFRGKDKKKMFTSIARLIHAWKRYGEVRRELSHLSDRELADIGISRSEISRIAWEHARR